ncbi:YadA-like family protein [Mesorhizobium sp. BAC0120]|uniref:YadA-like family protein n=1 Tax=Mesorhizobium sp. BAC0120 TaxID=3090670 RepID=UPI00298CE564|nr:YadA-like family protein [Mesorhizobium sp. BAC0120]MDW6025961.1 YadA-like family protein [Mesorhizobium sp. BAC0120]
MTSRQSTISQLTIAQRRPARFAGNWVFGAADSRPLRRRLMAALRMAHRSLGMKRDRLGLGALGASGVARLGGLIAIGSLGLFTSPAGANDALGGATVASPTVGAIAIGANEAGCATTIGPNAYAAIVVGCQASGDVTDPTAYAPAAGFHGPIVIGATSTSTGANALTLGYSSASHGDNAIVIGVGSVAGVAGTNLDSAIAIGRVATATNLHATALGWSVTASGADSLAVGSGAQATMDYATAVGRGARATNIATSAFGNFAVAQGNSALALGAQARAVGDSTVAVGQGAGAGSTTGNSGSVAMGIAAGTLVSGAQNTAMGGGIASVMRGAGSGVTGTRNVALGTGDGSVTYDGTLQASAGNLVTGSDNIAIGTNAGIGVTANATTSIGLNANGSADNAVAMGFGSTASGLNSVYLGSRTAVGTGALAQSAIAIGTDVTASQVDSIAIGRQSIAAGNGASAVGVSSNATGLSSAAFGRSANASGDFALAMGNAAVSSGTASVAMGSGAQGTDIGTIAMGNNAVAGAADAVAIGTGAQATGANSISIGAGNIVSGANSAAIGDPSTITGSGSYSLGNNNTINANNAFVVGSGVTVATGLDGAVVLGNGSSVSAAVPAPNVVIGGATYTFAGGAPAAGDVVSVGSAAAPRQIQNVAAGRISGTSTDAINGSQLFATNQAVGILNTTVNNITTGGGIKYFHANSTLPDSVAAGTDSVAIGPNAVANNAGDVAIGLNSVSGPTTAVGSAVIGGATYTFAGATPAGGAFSVGRVGAERQIQNVAAGQLSGTSTDAVNGSQLFATNQQVTQNTTDIANLDSSLTNIGDTINNIAGDTSTAYTDANGDGIRYVRTNDRTLPVTDSFAQGIGSTAVGYQATAVADSSLALGRGSNVTIEGGVALGSGSVSDRPIAPVSGSIISGTGIIPYNTTDLALLGAVSVGDATHYRQITNLADGTEDQDAVSLRQLKGALSSFAVTGTKYFHANSSASDSAAVGAESVAIGPQTTVNGDNGIGMGNHAIVQQTAPGGIAIGQNSTVNLADGIALGTGSTSNGIQATAVGAGATANEPGSVALGAGSTTAAAVATTGVTIKGVDYAFAGANPTSTVSVGSVGNERTITNVAAGRISETSTDAINGSQLHATNQAIENLETGVGDLTEFAVQYNKNVDGSKSNAITLVGGDVNAPVVIHNVAEGKAPTDAVNVTQLQNTLTESKSYTDKVAGTTLQTANAYTDSKFAQLNMDLDGIRSEAHQAAAVGLAAASLRYDDRPGKLSVAVGGGYWQDEGAFAFGAGYTSESGRVRANLSGTTTDGKWGVGAGLSLTLN